MKKTLNIDPKLLKTAREYSGAATDTEAIRLGLETLIQREVNKRLIAYAGSEPNAVDVPRRREKPKSKRGAA